MKQLLAICISLFLLPVQASAWSITNGLKAYWSFDETSGNAIDKLGVHTLTQTGGTIATATGKKGGARDFEAADNEWFTEASSSDLGNVDEDMTIACWVNLESNVADQQIVSKGTDGSNDGLYIFDYQQSSARFRFRLWGATAYGSGTTLPANNFGSPATATWYFVLMWHDSINDQIGIQVNNGTPDTAAHTAGGHSETGAFFIGGGYPFTTPNSFPFDGMLDECGFWKRVLTADEKTWLYNSGNGRSYPELTRGVRKPVIMQ